MIAACEGSISRSPLETDPSARSLSNDPIPVAITAWYLACFDTAALPTTNLQSEVLQEQSVHGALEAHVQFADLALSKSEEEDVGVS